MAEITLARSCPYMSMALVLTIVTLVAKRFVRSVFDPVGESGKSNRDRAAPREFHV